jgi:N-acetylglucosaminyl-diphospho-decaprenol L-rhamnosyltransferase
VDVSICVLTNRQPVLLPACVAACVAEIERSQMQAEIIVVDNASRDRYPAKLVDLYPQVKVMRTEESMGFSAGNNIAIHQSQGRNLLILNDDAILQEGSLELMIQKLESDPHIAAVGPKLLNPDGSLQKNFTNQRMTTLRSMICNVFYVSELFDRWWLTRRLLTQLKDDNVSGTTEELAGACLLIRRQALDDVGLFDESFFYWWEDKDLCWRLRRAGWSIFYIAEAQATHHKSASTGRLEKLERSMILYKSQMHFLKKYQPPWRYRLSKAALLLAFVCRAPIAFLYRLWRHSGDFGSARNSAMVSLGIARWLVTECE